MFSKIIIAFFLVFTLINASAQQIKSPVAFRMLQTANSLMEVQQLEAAEEYFLKGLKKAGNDDIYTQAYAHQGLGTLYNKLDQTGKAVENYQKAIKLYKSIKLNVLANVVESLLKSAQGIGDMYAGVEIGAKGVKMSIIEVKLSKDRQYDYTLIGDTAINTDAAELSYQSEKETTDALSLLWKIIKERYKIPNSSIHIVISSGLRQELEKYNKVDYFAYVVRPKEMDFAVAINSITPVQEAELSILGIVPQKDRFSANQLDVGSGNTKGGYFDGTRKVVPVTFGFGTKSYQRLVDARESGDISHFTFAAEKLWKDSIAAILDQELNDKGDIKSKDVVYLSGGIVWALTSYLYPQDAQKSYVEITAKDVADFRSMVFNSYEQLSKPPALLAISNTATGELARKNISRVNKTYDQRALTTGAIILDELVKRVNTDSPNKKFIYPRYGYVGWISGYIIKKVTHQYTAMLVSN
ncbi:MAG: tetratricopeptide repeat protein [Bacteroidota bacterium]